MAKSDYLQGEKPLSWYTFHMTTFARATKSDHCKYFFATINWLFATVSLIEKGIFVVVCVCILCMYKYSLIDQWIYNLKIDKIFCINESREMIFAILRYTNSVHIFFKNNKSETHMKKLFFNNKC